MKVKIKRFDTTLPLPAYQTNGAACFDLVAREETTIPPREVGYVPLNIALEPPAGHFFLLAARSSTHKKGLIIANGIGIGDPDFSGNDDEYKAAYYNFTDAPVTVSRGERIAQGMFLAFDTVEWEEVSDMENETRGGFGSTGTH